MVERALVALLACALLAACDVRHSPAPANSDWVFHSRLEVARGRLGASEFRLIIPSAAGVLNGPPTSASYLEPAVDSDLQFEVDLNPQHAALLDELAAFEPEEIDPFSRRPWYLDPRETRIASFFPAIIDARFNQLGNARWVNADTGNKLYLVFFDRPARLQGEFFDVRVERAGYVWIEIPERPELARVVAKPNTALVFDREPSRRAER